MAELRSLVIGARGGDLAAYGQIVRRFQDMAYGYAYAILGDFHLAEDAAQEAFIEAYRCLSKLREPAAFPGWFRRIVRRRCNRLTRRKTLLTVPLESAQLVASDGAGPAEAAERREMADRVLETIRALPEHERTVTTLFYVDGYSQGEIADFLEVPVTTVNNRLHASRERLRERMITMVEDELKGARPGPEFEEKVLREVRQVAVRPEKSPKDRGAVLLVDKDGRCLPIIIGRAEEMAIYRGVEGKAPPRPFTHELFVSALKAFGICVDEARVTGLRDSTFIAELVLARAGEEHALDSRPSDAIALAMMTGARVTVAEGVLARAASEHLVRDEADLERAWPALTTSYPEGFNNDLAELCEELLALPGGALADLVEAVGRETLAAALGAMFEEEVKEPGWERKVISVRPTVRPDTRRRLPDDVAQPLNSLIARLEQAGVTLDESCLPDRSGLQGVRKAREAIRSALRRGADQHDSSG